MEFMRKYVKYIIGVIGVLVILVGSFMLSKTFANPTIEVVKYVETSYPSHYGVLYSNNDLYLNIVDPDDEFVVIENVIDVFCVYDDLYYLDNEKNLYDAIYNKLIMENVKKVIIGDNAYNGTFMFITEDDKLYFYSTSFNVPSFLENKMNYYGLHHLFDNVKDCKFNYDVLLLRDNNNTLYAMGENYYGKKINEGNYLSDFTKLMDNVVQYDYSFSLDATGDLYMFNSILSGPTVVANNVSEFNSFADRGLFPFKIKDFDNKDYYGIPSIEENILDVELVEINMINAVDKRPNFIVWMDNFIKDSVLYELYFSDEDHDDKLEFSYRKIMENIKDVKGINGDRYLLTNDNVLYSIGLSSEFVNLTHIYMLDGNNSNKKIKIMDNVKDISYLENDVLIMADDTVWMYGKNEYNRFNDSSIVDSDIPVLVKGLPNVPDSIPVYDIDLITLEKVDFTVGTTYDYYVNVFPYNAVNREVVWKSTNEDVATVSDEGKITAISPGKTVISVETADGKIKEEVKITVHPDVNGIEIINGEFLDLELYEHVLLTAKVNPDDTLECDVVWSVSDKDAVSMVGVDVKNESSEDLPVNQRYVAVRKGGTYTVTVTTKNGLYSDSITINTVERVEHIDLEIDEDHFDGSYNAFIYLADSDKLKVRYKVMPDSATNKNVIWTSSNPEVAEVSNDGIIIGKKVGKTKITVESEDGSASRSFNLLVYDYNKNGVTGDVTGDGKVDIKDIIKLRRYLAGLEDLE